MNKDFFTPMPGIIITVLATLLALSACTSNSVSQSLDDSRNESLAIKNIRAANPALKESNISVTSFDGIVLITGQVPSADLIPVATAEVEPLRNVRRVHNELQVAGSTSLISRTNDSWLTTKAKSALSTSEKFDDAKIKVVTENETVYLMGHVTRAEADAAVEVVREVQGIQKIVKIFDYIN